MTNEERLALVTRLNDALTIIVPVVLLFLTVFFYLHRQYVAALSYLAIATGNVSVTILLQRRLERRRQATDAAIQAIEAEIERRVLHREHPDAP